MSGPKYTRHDGALRAGMRLVLWYLGTASDDRLPERIADAFGCSRATAYRWAAALRATIGEQST